MPRHVALIITDGNVRWAQKRGLPSSAGHEAGIKSLRNIIDLCRRLEIKVITVFAFSADNWTRPKAEVEFSMSSFERFLKLEIENFQRGGIGVSVIVIGDTSKLPNTLQNLVKNVEEITKNNSRVHLIVAASYNETYDVVQACKSIARRVKDGLIPLEDISENMIKQELETKCAEFPYPDLLIRTSGEYRLSNFLL